MIDGRQTVTLFPAVVTAYDAAKRTVTVEDADDLTLYDVLLTPVDGSANSKLFIQPTIGSVVLVGNVGNSEGRYEVLAFSKADKVRAIMGQVSIEASAAGVQVAFGEDTLKTMLNDLIDQIKLITVTTSGGPSGTPLNAALFDLIKTRINTVLY